MMLPKSKIRALAHFRKHGRFSSDHEEIEYVVDIIMNLDKNRSKSTIDEFIDPIQLQNVVNSAKESSRRKTNLQDSLIRENSGNLEISVKSSTIPKRIVEEENPEKFEDYSMISKDVEKPANEVEWSVFSNNKEKEANSSMKIFVSSYDDKQTTGINAIAQEGFVDYGSNQVKKQEIIDVSIERSKDNINEPYKEKSNINEASIEKNKINMNEPYEEKNLIEKNNKNETSIEKGNMNEISIEKSKFMEENSIYKESIYEKTTSVHKAENAIDNIDVKGGIINDNNQEVFEESINFNENSMENIHDHTEKKKKMRAFNNNTSHDNQDENKENLQNFSNSSYDDQKHKESTKKKMKSSNNKDNKQDFYYKGLFRGNDDDGKDKDDILSEEASPTLALKIKPEGLATRLLNKIVPFIYLAYEYLTTINSIRKIS